MRVAVRMRVPMRLRVRFLGLLHDAVECLRQLNVVRVQAAALEVCLRRILPLLQRLCRAPFPVVRLQTWRVFSMNQHGFTWSVELLRGIYAVEP